ncbi:MAG: proton-conducting transporter membrane subunit [Pseudomonadota bacterium]|nr:proton-conducting transporter membrane subunit [Pseudomonadota bacterium]
MNIEPLVLFAVLTPAMGAALIWQFRQWPNIRDGISLATAALLFALVVSFYADVAGGLRLTAYSSEIMPGLELGFVVEPLGLMFALVASLLWFVTTVYSIGYMRGQNAAHQSRFFIFFALSLSATIGIAFAANLFTLFIAYEALTLTTYPLVAHYGTPAAKAGARVYIGLLLSTSIGFLLVAIIWTWSLAGTLDFVPGGILAGRAEPWVVGVLLALYVFGIGKAAVMPFHRWLPSAMVAPAPVSALLHAVAVVKAGVFCVLKVVIYVFGIDLLAELGSGRWLMYVAAATILLASLVALREDNIKARLAYSTISQLSYIVLGAMLASSLGIIGGAMHIAMHAFGKITLFFCAGAIFASTGEIVLSRMRGVGRRMPFTMAAFFVASLSIIGLPPAGGLWSKWYLALGTLDAGEYLLLGVLLISATLNAAYLIPISIRAFFSPADNPVYDQGIHEAPPLCVAALCFSAFGCLVLFFYPDPFYQLATSLVQ